MYLFNLLSTGAVTLVHAPSVSDPSSQGFPHLAKCQPWFNPAYCLICPYTPTAILHVLYVAGETYLQFITTNLMWAPDAIWPSPYVSLAIHIPTVRNNHHIPSLSSRFPCVLSCFAKKTETFHKRCNKLPQAFHVLGINPGVLAFIIHVLHLPFGH